MGIKLNGSDEKEISDISGKGISFKKISIPGENCSNFQIKYSIINNEQRSISGGIIACIVSPYQRDVSQVILYKSILIPNNSILKLQLISPQKPAFNGPSEINYEIFTPTNQLSDIKVFISEKDRQNAFRIALINLARFFNIPNWEYDDNKTLYDKIISLKGSDAILIVELLKKYFTAYNEWFDFYVKIKDIETQTGQAYSLTNKEKDELSELIKNREGSLNILQTKFDELQLGKFNVSHGLGNIDGKIII